MKAVMARMEPMHPLEMKVFELERQLAVKEIRIGKLLSALEEYTMLPVGAPARQAIHRDRQFQETFSETP